MEIVKDPWLPGVQGREGEGEGLGEHRGFLGQ